jgi:hypothetical protein
MSNPEDRFPRDMVEPKQETGALRYELTVPLEFRAPFHMRRLVIRCYEDGRVICYIRGATLVKPGEIGCAGRR